MLNKKLIITIIVLVMFSITGCSKSTKDGQLLKPDTNIDQLKEQVKMMTMEEKIGQMVIIGLDGYTMNGTTKKMIEDYHVGGFILFGENIKNSDQLITLVNSLKNTNLKSKLPLFLSVDEEGGRVSRMPKEFKKLPTNKIIGKVNNEDFSYKIGNILGEEIKALGFNMDFAPVLDINSNPKNTVIGDRSFGTNSIIVSKLGIQTMKGIQISGVIPVVKHFPGHGDTSVDSHIGLPSVSTDINTLKRFELVPFDNAIKSGADAVMIAHILLNKIDSKNPASLSKIVITDLLRKQLNFNGLVITDDMTMGAVLKNYNINDAAIKSVNAGSDIVLVCHGSNNEIKVINALKEAVANGTISKNRVDESVYRILKLKSKYKLTDKITNSIDIKKINDKISAILNTHLNLK